MGMEHIRVIRYSRNLKEGCWECKAAFKKGDIILVEQGYNRLCAKCGLEKIKEELKNKKILLKKYNKSLEQLKVAVDMKDFKQIAHYADTLGEDTYIKELVCEECHKPLTIINNSLLECWDNSMCPECILIKSKGVIKGEEEKLEKILKASADIQLGLVPQKCLKEVRFERR